MTTKKAWLAISLCSVLGLFIQCNTRTPVGEVNRDGGSPGTGGSAGGNAGTGLGGGAAGTNGVAGTSGVAGIGGNAGAAAGSSGVPCPTTTPVTDLFLAPTVLDYPKTALATNVGVADLNGDGIGDIIVGGQDAPPPISSGGEGGSIGGGGAGGSSTASVTVFLANKAGGFAQAVSYPGPIGFNLAVADLDGDKLPDVVTAFPNAAIRLNQGGGVLGAATSYDVPGSYGFTAADLDGDGKAELLFATTGGLTVLKSAGGSNYSSKTYDEGFNASAVAAGDLDGLPGIDVVVSGATDLHVLLNDGSGHLAAPMSLGGTNDYWLDLVDIDGDSKLDIVATHSNGIGGTQASVLLNLGGGQFAVPRQLPLYGRVLFGDLDGDGKADAVMVSADCSSLALALNDGHGSFGAPSFIASTAPDTSVLAALGDVNGDKALDLVTATKTGVSVRLHRAP